MGGGAVRVCVECGRWRASVGREEGQRKGEGEETEGRGPRPLCLSYLSSSRPTTTISFFYENKRGMPLL